jgi:hypothetical protein
MYYMFGALDAFVDHHQSLYQHSLLTMPRKAESSSPSKLKQKTLVGFFSSPPASFPTSQTPKRAKPKSRKRGRVVSPESESDYDVDNKAAGSDDSDVGAIHFEPEVIDVCDEDESPRRPRAIRQKPRLGAESSNSDEKNNYAALPGVSSMNKTRRKSGRFGKRKQVEEDSGSEEEVQPKKRKFIKGVRPSSPEEDEEDLLDEVDEHREHLLHILFVLNVVSVPRYHRTSFTKP